MLIKMIRTQTTDLGTFRAGIAYRFDEKKHGHKAFVKGLIDRGVAEKTDAKALKNAKAEAEKVSKELAKLNDVPETEGGDGAEGATDGEATE